jgi:hypothetical protein
VENIGGVEYNPDFARSLEIAMVLSFFRSSIPHTDPGDATGKYGVNLKGCARPGFLHLTHRDNLVVEIEAEALVKPPSP